MKNGNGSRYELQNKANARQIQVYEEVPCSFNWRRARINTRAAKQDNAKHIEVDEEVPRARPMDN